MNIETLNQIVKKETDFADADTYTRYLLQLAKDNHASGTHATGDDYACMAAVMASMVFQATKPK